MRRFIDNATALLVLLLAADAVARAENRALLVGIGRYQVAEARLPGVGRDLDMMREVVRTLGYGEAQVKVLADSAATLDGIRDAIESWLIDGTTPADRAFLYHSGHGTRIADASGDEVDGSDEVLLPHDFEEHALRGDEKRLTNVLLDDELGDLLRRIPAREVVVFVDSCNSGTVTRSVPGLTSKSKFYSYPGIPGAVKPSLADPPLARRSSVILLGAAKEDQDAQTTVEGALFTRGIHQAVRRSAAARYLTLEQLQRETSRSIRHLVGDKRDRLHQPTLYGNLALGRMNLFLEPSSEAGEPPAAAAPRPGPDLWSELELLVRDAGEILEVTAGKSLYRVGESLELAVTAPHDGHLNVLNVGDGEDELVLLFPNEYQRNNRVRRGETIRIPPAGGFRLPARLPPGRQRQRNLVAVIHTAGPLNLFDEGASARETFRIFGRGDLTRSITRKKGYSAGQVVVTVESAADDTPRAAGSGRGPRVTSSAEILRRLARTRSFGVARAELQVNFELNVAELDAAGRRQAVELGRALTDAAAPRGTLVLLGHTDRLCPRWSPGGPGCDRFNLDLSARRAAAVRQFLAVRFGLPGDEIRTLGCGRRYPSSDDDEENRRVVVMVLDRPQDDAERLCGDDAGLL